MIRPTAQFELALIGNGYQSICGIDEVGRGAWAGPVVAAAVIIPVSSYRHLDPPAGGSATTEPAEDDRLPWSKIRDSKTLSKKQREILHVFITDNTIWAVGECSNVEIDMIGIAPATQLAMKRAVDNLEQVPDYLLLDGREKVDLPIKQEAIIDGDALCISIAAASIIAKEYRDALMVEYDQVIPGYNFSSHVGYGTKQHIEALSKQGICPIHRTCYEPIKKFMV